jgi:streptogramin lyase
VLVTDLGRWDAPAGRLLLLSPRPGGYDVRPCSKGLDRPHGLQAGPDGQVYLAEAGASCG